MTADVYVGREVHQKMWDQKLTIRSVADHLGMDESTLSRKLRGGRKWSLDTLRYVLMDHDWAAMERMTLDGDWWAAA